MHPGPHAQPWPSARRLTEAAPASSEAEAAPTGDRATTPLIVLVVTLGACLRLWAITRAAGNPFYDAAVRSMGSSWHNFFFGALEPGGSVSIDKPPADLWVQVASTRLLGFTTFALHLPEALCGTATVALIFFAVRSVWGSWAGLLAALALAVAPIAVLTSRSDTMDSVMTALLVASLWASIRALQTGRGVWVMLAAGLIGVAFNVKLAEALVPLPAFVVMWAAAARPRLPVLVGAGTTLVVVGMSWIVIASLTPAAQRPHPIGSGTGSIYRVVFLFNGLDRVSGRGPQLGPTDPTPSGPLRLVDAGGNYAQLVGGELVAALALALARLVATMRRSGGAATLTTGSPRVARWTAVGLGLWLAVAVVLFSAVPHLQTRYLEAASPPLAVVLGVCAAALLGRSAERFARRALAGALAVGGGYAIGLASDWTGRLVAAVGLAIALACLLVARRPGAAERPVGLRRLGEPCGLAVVVAVALFALPARLSVDLVDRGLSDAANGNDGAVYSAFLRAHRQHAEYEVASSDTLGVVGLISSDGQPVLILDDLKGPLVRLATLERLVARGAVRYVLLDHPCVSGVRCPATTRWSVAHAVRIRGYLYRYAR